jgi:hypothetical protein
MVFGFKFLIGRGKVGSSSRTGTARRCVHPTKNVCKPPEFKIKKIKKIQMQKSSYWDKNSAVQHSTKWHELTLKCRLRRLAHDILQMATHSNIYAIDKLIFCHYRIGWLSSNGRLPQSSVSVPVFCRSYDGSIYTQSDLSPDLKRKHFVSWSFKDETFKVPVKFGSCVSSRSELNGYLLVRNA